MQSILTPTWSDRVASADCSSMEDDGGMVLNFARKRPAEAPAASVAKQETPAKRARVDGKTMKKISQDAMLLGTEDPTAALNRPFVSSLFTHNPEVTRAAKGENTVRPSKATNATVGGASFASLNVDAKLVAALEAQKMTSPTEIQVSGTHFYTIFLYFCAFSYSLFSALPVLLSGRDALLQAETGSGKTLAFLLPIVQRIAALTPRIDRSHGTLAVILSPTRELAAQTYAVLEWLCRAAVWIVPGCVTGGEKRQSEKARLRKGVTILVATPGRLKDHLAHTQSFLHSSCSWFVLDEADRLLDMGFEKDVLEIAALLRDHRRPSALDAQLTSAARQQIILCSATLGANVQRVAAQLLSDPALVRTSALRPDTSADDDAADNSTKVAAPRQLKQQYTLVPLKLRLMTLIAAIRGKKSGSKGAVFFATCDSVDFHHALFTWPDAAEAQEKEKLNEKSNEKNDFSAPKKRSSEAEMVEQVLRELQADQDKSGRGALDSDDDDDKTGFYDADAAFARAQQNKLSKSKEKPTPKMTLSHTGTSALLGNISVFRLHGDMPQSDRVKTISEFSSSSTPSILLCTDVAARGLDLPDLEYIIQYDAPSDTRDYVHRIGRTARLGRAGTSLLFLMPHESAYISHLRSRQLDMSEFHYDDILRTLAVRKSRMNHEYEAQQIHNSIEARASSGQLFSLASRAFHSFVRSYATHSKDEKAIFHPKMLHLGHLAKSFGLREPPGRVGIRVKNAAKKEAKKEKKGNNSKKDSKNNSSLSPMKKRVVVSEFGGEAFYGPVGKNKKIK